MIIVLTFVKLGSISNAKFESLLHGEKKKKKKKKCQNHSKFDKI